MNTSDQHYLETGSRVLISQSLPVISVEEPCRCEVVRASPNRHFGNGRGQRAEQNSLAQKELFEGCYRHGALGCPALYPNIIGVFAEFDCAGISKCLGRRLWWPSSYTPRDFSAEWHRPVRCAHPLNDVGKKSSYLDSYHSACNFASSNRWLQSENS